MFILLEKVNEQQSYVFKTPEKTQFIKKRVKRIQKRRARIIDSFEGVSRKLDFSLMSLEVSTGQNHQRELFPASSSNFSSKFLR